MAAPPFDRALQSAPFFDIYNDGILPSHSPGPLPSGPCNFADLSHGASGPKCGCRRFWARSALGASADQAGWCMCSHHACFHDEVRGGITSAPAPENFSPGLENEKPRSTRDPLSPVEHFPPYMSSIDAAADPHIPFPPASNAPVAPRAESPAPPDPAAVQTRPAPPYTAETETSIPDTLSWVNLLQSQSGSPPSLPPIPSQCLMPQASQATSINSSNQRYLRPFAGRGLNTLGSRTKSREPPNNRLQELASNSDSSIPDTLPQQSTHASQPSGPDPVERPPLQPTERASRDSVEKLAERVSGHDQRLERLETVSFSAAGHEDCQEKHDNMDLRVTELEVMMNDGHHQAANRHVDEAASIVSVLSASTNNNVSQTDRTAELCSQIQQLRAQVDQLQSLSPSLARPWEVEVVFLPFPLKGVWMEASGFPSQRLSDHSEAQAIQGDQWTQLPNSHSVSAFPFRSPRFQDWAPEGAESGWLLPRACAPEKLIDRRLKSRGLIRKVSVRGPDARSVQVAVSDAFGDILQVFSPQKSQGHQQRRRDSRLASFLGLQEPWVPLRKIHKDSRLRFLSPSEMVTSALWDVNFLASGVTMKATSIHRLYVTQPAAYLQDSESFDSGWAWQEVRELGRYPPQPPAVGDDPTAAVKEDCWEWNGRLDEVPTPSSSVSLSTRQPQQRLPKHSPSPTPDFFTGKEYPSMSSLSRSGQGQVARKAPARPAHLRTASVPPVAAEMMSPALRRRVTASVFERKSSPMPRPMALAVAKRRQTRSPNIWQRNTPRWSTSSPSPAIDIARGVTPGVQYYATPFSNGTYEPRRGVPGDHHDADDEDRGSATDPYDECSEMTQPEDGNVSEWRQPEDDPWPGLPDHPMSDSENVDPLSTAPSGAEDEGGDHGMEDVGSEASSQPSEYPSTQSVWQGNGVAGDFRIHEDEEDDGMGAMQS